MPNPPQPPQRGGKSRSSRLTSGDEESVAGLDDVASNRAGRKLGDLVGAPDEGNDHDQGQQALMGLDDDPGFVDEDGIDGKAHEHHVDAIAAVDQQPAVLRQPRPPHQSQPRGDEIAGHLERLRDDRPVLFCQSQNPFSVLYGPPGPRERRFSAMRALEAFVARFYLCWNVWMMMITAGPITTMNRVGKMQPIIGKSIFSGACAACSSAR